MESSTTRPTATASPPRVMMLIVIPVVDMRMIAARTLNGMLTAATTVERRLSRKIKITTTAKPAPRPPSVRSASMDSRMKTDESVTMERSTSCEWLATNSSIAAIDSSAVVTVFASADLLTLSARPGAPLVSDQPVVRTSASETVATWPRKTGTGCPVASTEPPTTSCCNCSIEVKRPVAETGTSAPSTGSWPAGKVRLFP